MRKVLSIAGSDPSGGAGIQADLKTFAAHGVYGASVLTALTAQNTQGVQSVLPLDPGFVAAQLESVFTDIGFHAIKIGMLHTGLVMQVVANALESYAACPVVLDPVMVATSGDRLLRQEAEAFLRSRLLPLVAVCTPNLAEARVLSGEPLTSQQEIEKVALQMAASFGTAFLFKGGHSVETDTTTTTDTLALPTGELHLFSKERIDTVHTHGTGCTLSAAIACRLADGFLLPQAVSMAKDYLHRAIVAGKDLAIGKGSGPVWHGV